MTESLAPRISGAVILNQLEYLVARFGREAYERALAQLPDRERQEVEELLAIGWIQSSTAKQLKDNLAALVGLSSNELQVQVVRAALAQTFNVFWRLLLRRLSGGVLVKRAPILYSRTFDRGELVARVLGEGRAELDLSGCPGMPDYDALGLATGITCVIEHSGRAGVSTKWRRRGDRLVFEVSWPRGSSSGPAASG